MIYNMFDALEISSLDQYRGSSPLSINIDDAPEDAVLSDYNADYESSIVLR